MSALSGLARVRRKALLIDSGEYRNLLTRHAHDIIGSDGVTPAYFRANAREQISLYPTVSMKNGTVTDIQQVNSSCFSATDADGNQYTSRKVVLATGLKDVLPSTPGIDENWARGIYWCPWCDGYEHRDQPLGLMGTLDKVPGLIREIETLNSDLIAFVNGTLTPANMAALAATEPDWEALVKTYNVQIENRTITEVQRTQDGGIVYSAADKAEYDQFTVYLDDGTAIVRAAIFTDFGSVQRSDLGRKLGVTMVQDKFLLANFTGGMATNIDGVYAVGDANSDGSTNVPHAMWSGKRAAVQCHITMAEEDAESAIAQAGAKAKRGAVTRRDVEESLLEFMGKDIEDLWR